MDQKAEIKDLILDAARLARTAADSTDNEETRDLGRAVIALVAAIELLNKREEDQAGTSLRLG